MFNYSRIIVKISRNAEHSHLFLISSTIRGNGASFNQCSADVKTLPNGSLYPSFSRRRSRGLWRREFRTCWWNITSSAGILMAKPSQTPDQITLHLQKNRDHTWNSCSFVVQLCHMAEMLSVCVSWHNSFTFCDSCKSLSVQTKEELFAKISHRIRLSTACKHFLSSKAK